MGVFVAVGVSLGDGTLFVYVGDGVVGGLVFVAVEVAAVLKVAVAL